MANTTCPACGLPVIRALVEGTDKTTLVEKQTAYFLAGTPADYTVRPTPEVFINHFLLCRPDPRREEKTTTNYEDSLTQVTVMGRSYEHKRELKPLGFRWDPLSKTWMKFIKDTEVDALDKLLREKTEGECKLGFKQ